jgi:uncharacterized protein (UPF0147 family)
MTMIASDALVIREIYSETKRLSEDSSQPQNIRLAALRAQNAMLAEVGDQFVFSSTSKLGRIPKDATTEAIVEEFCIANYCAH